MIVQAEKTIDFAKIIERTETFTLRYKILIADDEPGIVDMVKSYFSTEYDILTAANGREVLEKAALQPDLILLDINMPEATALRCAGRYGNTSPVPSSFSPPG